jgi:sporulation protein YlmC with PRC-barrel domain
MILSDLLHNDVRGADGTKVGVVIDVRFVLDGTPSQLLADARLHGVIVSRSSSSTFLGYERSDANAPVLLARLLAWRHRGSFLVRWADIALVNEHELQLRPGYTRYSPNLPSVGD